MNSVDVIVPCYRYAQFLRQCVRSVLSQSSLSVRVLIIDDASPDNTAEVAYDLAREDQRITVARHPTNKGHIASYNEGLEWASAKYLLLLSADDYLLPGALSRATEIMESHPEVGLSYGKALELRDGDTSNGTSVVESICSDPSARILSGREFIELNGSRNIVPTPTAVVRASVQRKVGLYRPELPHSGDMEMWLRMAAHASVASLNAHQAVYRRHSNNMSLAYYRNSRLADLQQRKAALDSFFHSSGELLREDQELRQKLLWTLAFEAIGYASSAFNENDIFAVDQLSDFALDLSPEAKMSFPWAKLTCKRRLGLKRWRAMNAIRSKWFSH
jgi:glycosyltransferase involved in cell wall biosynthesis